MENKTAIDSLLEKREDSHGDFLQMADLAQNIKRQMNYWRTWENRNDMVQAMDMIATKLARIICGDPDNVDHWEDIEGYARLISRRLKKELSLAKSIAK